MISSSCRKETHLWLGLVAFVVGAVVLLQLFGVVPDTTWDYLWPTILVVVGLKLMISSCENGDDCCGMNCDPSEMKMAAPKKKAPARKKRPTKKKK